MSFQTIAYSVEGQLTVTTVVSGLWQKHVISKLPCLQIWWKIRVWQCRHCLLCGLLTDHILTQTLCCKLWDAIITCCGYNVFIRLSKLDPQQQYKRLINTVLQYSADEWEFNKLLIALCNTVFNSRDLLCLLDMTLESSLINR